MAEWPTGVPAHPVVRRYRGLLRMDEAPGPAPVPSQTRDLSRPGCFRIDAWGGDLWVEPVASGGLAPVLLTQATLHGREQAEERQFALAPRAAARSLKKQYQALGVPPWQRGGPFVSGAGGELLFVPGLGINASHIAPEGSAQLSLRWQRDEPAA
jgi:tRNA(Ile)-lysidine synthase